VDLSLASPNFLSSHARYGITIVLVLAGFVSLGLLVDALTNAAGADEVTALLGAALVGVTCFILAYFSVMGTGKIEYRVRVAGTPAEVEARSSTAHPSDGAAAQDPKGSPPPAVS
jgi:formate hydrogenlyase subunit 3/multisubunit Na+/H+ antiporter MnhD subunit